MSHLTRRWLLRSGLAFGAAAWGFRHALAADAAAPIAKPIPSTGERLPVIGVGTNAFDTGNYADVRAVLARMAALGGTVIDTAASYGYSEAVIGRALDELGLRSKMFIATKFNAAGAGWGPGEITGRESFQRSLRRLRSNHVDLIEVHRLAGLEALLPLMQELRQQGSTRYIGVTTYQLDEHAGMAQALRRHALDFVQIDYSLGNRDAAREVLPAAQDHGVAVMVNVPLGGSGASLLSVAGNRPLPSWVAEFGVRSWSQFFLKYIVSHPAVTCVIPGSTRVAHIEDNQAAGQGRLPDAAQRRRMEEYWDSLR